MAVSYVECDGKHCDDLRFHCAKPLQWTLDMSETPVVTGWFSEEEGRKDCPDGKVVTGVECKDSKKWCLSNFLGVLTPSELPRSAEPAPPSPSPW
eukprot:g12998.t1